MNARDAGARRSSGAVERSGGAWSSVPHGARPDDASARHKHFTSWQSLLAPFGPRPPNLLVLGASGHVAGAFLRDMETRRAGFGRVVLLDQDDRAFADKRFAGRDFEFVKRRLHLPKDANDYRSLLRKYQIDIVLDVTDLDTLPVLAATDSAGVSYVNSSLNGQGQDVSSLLQAVHPNRKSRRSAPHIVSSGMNPGVVNLWVWHGVRFHGIPEEIVHFEYDTSMTRDGWRPLITWSPKEFLAEAVLEPTGRVVHGKVRMLDSNSLENRQDLRDIMEPIMPLRSYPKGMLILHEENVKMGRRLGISSKYIYAIHPRTMDYMERIWRERGRVDVDDLTIGDNTTLPLDGADTIGVCLEYPGRRVYYLHSLANAAVSGTNATCAQVAVGLKAALAALTSERLEPRVYFPSDLYETVYRDVVFRSLHVEVAVLDKRQQRLISRDQLGAVSSPNSGGGRNGYYHPEPHLGQTQPHRQRV